MALTRTPDWDIRDFRNFLLANASTPFSWSTNDCCTFAANAIKSFTGVDIADSFRGKYTDQASAFSLIKTITGGITVADAAAYCASKHGLPELISPLMAQRGDLVVIKTSAGLLAGVVHLNGRHVVTVGEQGLLRLPIHNVQRAWRV